MRLRIIKVTELNLSICIENNIWGSEQSRLKSWAVGENLVFTVDKHLAAMAVVIGKPFSSNDLLWKDNLYPHRVPVKFTHFAQVNDRPPLIGQVRDILMRHWGKNYGFGILAQRLIEGQDAESIVGLFTTVQNSLPLRAVYFLAPEE